MDSDGLMRWLSAVSQSLRAPAAHGIAPAGGFVPPAGVNGHMLFSALAQLHPNQITDLRHNPQFQHWLGQNNMGMSPFDLMRTRVLFDRYPRYR